MGNKTKIALISAGSSLVTSAVVGFICFVKGKQKGIIETQAKFDQLPQQQAGNQARQARVSD